RDDCYVVASFRSLAHQRAKRGGWLGIRNFFALIVTHSQCVKRVEEVSIFIAGYLSEELRKPQPWFQRIRRAYRCPQQHQETIQKAVVLHQVAGHDGVVDGAIEKLLHKAVRNCLLPRRVVLLAQKVRKSLSAHRWAPCSSALHIA